MDQLNWALTSSEREKESMEHGFWHERWAHQQIGFHQKETNLWLQQYWPLLGVSDDCQVLVPLCGKSKDMLWLREQGHSVLGVELSDIACRDFFNEMGAEVTALAGPKFHTRALDGITLHCGDFFKLEASDVAHVGAVYDRAALIALPHAMRKSYAAHLKAILPSGMRVLLVALEYDEQRESPPFSVSETEVRKLYEPVFTVELMDGAECENGRFEGEREKVYFLTRQ